MAEREPLVALLFDDAGLSAHLRDALVEHGARIVYESDLSAFAPAELVGSSADVVVVDLDDPSDDDLDRLYDTVEGGHPRLVFNDADASRGLDGWNRARWARHLAAKLIGETPLDPPRPDDSRAIEPRVAAIAGIPAPAEEVVDEALTDELSITGIHGYPQTAMATEVVVPVVDDAPDIEGDLGDELAFSTPLSDVDDDEEAADPTTLAAELAAMLADSDPAVDHSDGLDTIPSVPVELTELASMDLSGFEVIEEAPAAAPVPEREFDLSQFTLASLDEPVPGTPQQGTPTIEIESRATEYVPAPAPEWDLVDHDAIVAESATRPDASEFGIETIGAAEFLAMDVVDDGTHGIEPGLSLELMSIEAAVAPVTTSTFSHEMFLEGSARAVRRVVALVGTQESEAALAAFLAALPVTLPAAILVVAHHDGEPAAFAARLGGLRLASNGAHVVHGERLVVPRGSHVQVRRDGGIVVREDGSASYAKGPSIDGVLSTLATGFGADALAIVFAGRSNDAVAGAQAIYDAGGRVWVESVPVETEAGHMVAGIRAERVAAFAGDTVALLQKLNEELP